MSVAREVIASVSLLVLVVFALFLPRLASADVQVCAPGTSAGKCNSPSGLAVDFETGLLYVADTGNNRIDVFQNGGKEPGTPASFGMSAPVHIAVDNVATSPSHHDIYATTADFTVKKFEPNGILADEFGEHGDGTPEGCQLEGANDPVAVGPNGDIYLADSYQTGASGNFANRIVKFDATGKCIGTVPLFEGTDQSIGDLVVDSAGVIYVTADSFVEGDVIRQYSGTGTLLRQFEGRETKGLAVDATDHLFAGQQGVRVTKNEADHFFTEYDSAAGGGAILRHFGFGPAGFSIPPDLAAYHGPGGDLFVSNPSFDNTGVKYFASPPLGPVLYPEACKVKNDASGSVRATLQAEVDPEGKASTFKFEYMTQAQFEAEGDQFKNAHSGPEVALGGSADFELQEAAQTVEPLEAEKMYRCRIVARNADSGPAGTVGEEGTFETEEPFTFGPTWSAEVGETGATINAEGNPNGAAATGQIEYVTDAQYQVGGFAKAVSAPTPPLDYGVEEKMVLRSTKLTGLAPGTLYHYRLRAKQALFPEGLVCPGQKPSCPGLEHTFRTALPEEARPDGRGYELVSPGQKNSAEVVGSTPNGRGFIGETSVQIQAGASSGEAVTYTSWTSFADPEGAPGTSQYVSRRTMAGWVTANASPFGFQSDILVPPYLGFSPDLRFGAVKAGETSLAPGCPVGVENFYFYEADTGKFRCLTTEAPQTTNKFGYCFVYGGASEDGSRVFFTAQFPYANAKAGGSSLYESHEGKLGVVDVLPGETEPVTPTEKSRTSFGMKTPEACQTGQSVLHDAISADGSRVIWTYVPGTGASGLMDRIDGSETVQLDKVQSGAGQSGEGVFWGAGKDGSIVYFTSPNRLISGVKAETGAEDLYRYDFSKPIGSRLSDLTVKGAAPGAVKGVIGASEDGSIVYFVAGSALTPESETNAAGQHAEEGKNNLYVNDMNEGKTRFITQLSNEDNLDWNAQPKAITARVTPDGQHLAFLSNEAKTLAHFDNTLTATKGTFASSEHCRINTTGALSGSSTCPEAFLYDKQAGSLTCASCNPAGSRPVGPALLPGWSSMSEGPRYLSDDGDRLFFETYDSLLPADEDDKRDVYEFERPGTGTCSASSPNFDSVSGGCHFLVSNGKSSDESFFIDASTTGRDVFFSTRSALTGWDVNENYDVYDYREGGGFPEPTVPVSCTDEASCKPPLNNAPPTPPSLVTSSFSGPGNPTPSRSSNPPASSKSLTAAQVRALKLSKALRVCRAPHNKRKRNACERQAHRHYGPLQARSKKAKSRKGGK